MTFTFSQLADLALARSVRPDRTQEVYDFINATIRECHTNNQRQAVFFSKNLVEDQLTTDADSGYTWAPPSGFQRMQTVRFPNVVTAKWPLGVYPRLLVPGRAQNNEDYFYYRNATDFAFKGYGASGNLIDIAYYKFPPRLFYKAAAGRETVYTVVEGTADVVASEGFTYNTVGGTDYNSTTTLQATAKTLNTNWLIEDWYDVIFEGTMAKIYKLFKDTERAATHFSLYEQQRVNLFSTEVHESLAA